MTTEGVKRAGRREWIGLLVLALPCLVYSMDLTVLNLAVPTISEKLRPSTTGLLWIVDVYGFFVAALLITMGTLGDRIGRRRLLFIGAAGFALASILAATATSAGALIAARALLGVAGATIAPSTLSLITVMFQDPAERTRAIGFWVMSFSLGAAIGPLVGGVLLEHLWWGSVFLVAVPPVVALLAIGPRVLPEFRDPDAGRIDLASVGLSLVAILALVYGMKQAALDGFESGVAPLALGLVLGGLFVRRQAGLDSPLLDLGLLRRVRLSASLAINLLSFFAVFGVGVLEAQFLQGALGLSPLVAGLWSLPGALGFVVGSSITDRLVSRHPQATVVSTGLLVGATGLALIAIAGGGLAVLVAGSTLLALGLGPVVTLTADLVVSAAPPERAGSAAALNETSSELGGALGIAVLGSVLAAIYRAGLPADAPTAARDSIGGALAVGHHTASPGLVEAARDSFIGAYQATAGIGAALLLVAAAIAAHALRHRHNELPAPAPIPSASAAG